MEEYIDMEEIEYTEEQSVIIKYIEDLRRKHSANPKQATINVAALRLAVCEAVELLTRPREKVEKQIKYLMKNDPNLLYEDAEKVIKKPIRAAVYQGLAFDNAVETGKRSLPHKDVRGRNKVWLKEHCIPPEHKTIAAYREHCIQNKKWSELVVICYCTTLVVELEKEKKDSDKKSLNKELSLLDTNIRIQDRYSHESIGLSELYQRNQNESTSSRDLFMAVLPKDFLDWQDQYLGKTSTEDYSKKVAFSDIEITGPTLEAFFDKE